MEVKSMLEDILSAFSLDEERIVYYICGGESLPVPFTSEEESFYLRLAESGDNFAKSQLIEHNLRLVIYIARKFDNTGVDREDLISVGTIGLIKAINSFNRDKNIKLATYASRCVENEILMHLRKIAKIKTEVSFDEPLNVDFEGNELLLSDILGTDGDTVYRDIEESAEKEMLFSSLNKLNDREKEIIEMRFGIGGYHEKTQKEVADQLGISQSYISRLEKKILYRLKKEMVKIS